MVLYLSTAIWLHCGQNPSAALVILFPISCRRVSKPFIKKNDPKNEALAKLGMMKPLSPKPVSSLLSGHLNSSAERAVYLVSNRLGATQ